MTLKRLFCVLMSALLLLCGCGDKEVPDNAFNTPTYCQIGDTVYYILYDRLRAVNNARPDGLSLCFDPLCDHFGDELCAEMDTHFLATDGERIYIRRGGEIIYSMKQDGSDIRYVVRDHGIDGLQTGFSTDGEYIYYVDGFYNSDERDVNDSYGVPMMVPCKGGKPKVIADGNFSAYATAYGDENNYYIADIGSFTVINRESGEVTTVPLEAEHCYGMYMVGGEAYVYVIEYEHPYEINCKFNFQRNALLKWDGKALVPAVRDVNWMVFDHERIWYRPMLPVEDFELIGTKDSYDGRGMSAYDFIRTWENKLICRDLVTGEETVYTFEESNLNIDPIGFAGGYLIATVCDYSSLTFDWEFVNLKPEENGTVTVHGAIKSEREMAE